jgi:hypothetical protein
MADNVTTIAPTATGSDTLVEQQNADAQDALQAALDTHRELNHTQIDLDRALAANARAYAAHRKACAKLLPFQVLAKKVAA